MTITIPAPGGTRTQLKPAKHPSQGPSTASSRARQRARDQFYTAPGEAARLLGVAKGFLSDRSYLFIEPSAGSGSFLHIMPKGSIGYDLYPKCRCIAKVNFLKVVLPPEQPIAVIGNPPFGKNAALIIDFFNRAASHPNVMKIAFIFPLSIRKAGKENRLDPSFHLVHEEAVSKNAFIFNGQPHHVPTVFQVWERRDTTRELRAIRRTHPDFELTTVDDADFAIRRNGGCAGKVYSDPKTASKSKPGSKNKDTYFIRSKVKHLRDVEAIMRSLDFESVVTNVAGARSLAMAEIVTMYQARLDADAKRSGARRP